MSLTPARTRSLADKLEDQERAAQAELAAIAKEKTRAKKAKPAK